MLLVIMWFPLLLNLYAMPLIAMLSDSVPPLVNIISSVFAPMMDATFSLLDSIALLASLPREYSVEAFP